VRSKVVCLELGACDYITKPFELAELIARVRLRARRRQPAGNRYLRNGGYVLDLQRRVVQNGGAAVPLTTREFVLLEYLMEHQDETCTRDELLEHVWGYTYGDSATVTVHVRRLREKLEDDPSDPRHLSTVWGVGYRWDP
jgi:DNA-binding response OmpR family regulator